MKLSDFDFDLPEPLIAAQRLQPRQQPPSLRRHGIAAQVRMPIGARLGAWIGDGADEVEQCRRRDQCAALERQRLQVARERP